MPAPLELREDSLTMDTIYSGREHEPQVWPTPVSPNSRSVRVLERVAHTIRRPWWYWNAMRRKLRSSGNASQQFESRRSRLICLVVVVLGSSYLVLHVLRLRQGLAVSFSR